MVTDGGSDEIEWWEFEPLSDVLEIRRDGVREAVVLLFAQRFVEFSAVPEDDTLCVREVEVLPESSAEHEVRVASEDSPWNRFVGASVRWGREMTNHHGYLDGYQLEFDTAGSVIGDGIELIVAATSIRLGTSWSE